MAKLLIKTNEFLDWKCSNRDELAYLGRLQLNHLKHPDKHPKITLTWMYNSTRSIPKKFITTCSEPIKDEWTPSETDEVKWH